jgi:hypothetical protein
MAGLRFTDLEQKPTTVLDMTSLTINEFQALLPAFEAAFQAHMAEWCLDGKPRTTRRYTTYTNCPLPSPQDRLLFILIYLKTNPLQVAHGLLFNLPQGKTNQWIHVLLPVLRAALRNLGDAPSRTLADLARRLGLSEASQADAIVLEASEVETSEAQVTAPLFVMMAPSGALCAPRTRMNRKAVTAARKSVMR